MVSFARTMSDKPAVTWIGALNQRMRETLGTAHLCPCYSCQDDPSRGLMNPVNVMMIVCPDCGNKRCPKATQHDNPCTGSNEPGQVGSRYGMQPSTT